MGLVILKGPADHKTFIIRFRVNTLPCCPREREETFLARGEFTKRVYDSTFTKRAEETSFLYALSWRLNRSFRRLQRAHHHP